MSKRTDDLMDIIPTREQIHAARSLLDWSVADLARHSGIDAASIEAIEHGRMASDSSHEVGMIVRTLAAHGIVFTHDEGAGVRLEMPTEAVTPDELTAENDT